MSEYKRMLPDWIDGFLLLTKNSEPPKMFKKWTAISAIASALQRKVKVEWGTSLTFYPNFYIVLVGPSATGKNTAMNFALDIMSEIPTIQLAAQSTTRQALIRRLQKTNLTDIDSETGKQLFHSSMTIFSKEFTVFLGYHNVEMISALCDWYDCDNRWKYETISREVEEIIGVWVNIIGGTTPDSLRASLPIESIGAGLTSRIIFVVEDTREKLVTLPMRTQEEIELQQMLIRDLEHISMLSGTYHYTEDFVGAWDTWCRRADETPPFSDPKFDGYNGRRRAHLMKLCMIVSASHGRNEMILTQDDLERAIELLQEVEVRMGLVFKGMGRSTMSDMVSRAIAFVVGSRTKEIPVWQFARHFESDLDKLEMDRVLTTMETMKIISISRKPGADQTILVLEDGSGNERTIEKP